MPPGPWIAVVVPSDVEARTQREAKVPAVRKCSGRGNQLEPTHARLSLPDSDNTQLELCSRSAALLVLNPMHPLPTFSGLGLTSPSTCSPVCDLAFVSHTSFDPLENGGVIENLPAVIQVSSGPCSIVQLEDESLVLDPGIRVKGGTYWQHDIQGKRTSPKAILLRLLISPVILEENCL